MEDFSAIQSNITSALVSTTRGASALVSEDVSFHRSLDASLGSALDRQNARLLGLTERLLGAATADTEIVRPPRLKDLESVDGNWTAVVDVLDSLLERADTALDEFTGAVKRLSPGAEQVKIFKMKEDISRTYAENLHLGISFKASKAVEDCGGSEVSGHGETAAEFRTPAYE